MMKRVRDVRKKGDLTTGRQRCERRALAFPVLMKERGKRGEGTIPCEAAGALNQEAATTGKKGLY